MAKNVSKSSKKPVKSDKKASAKAAPKAAAKKAPKAAEKKLAKPAAAQAKKAAVKAPAKASVKKVVAKAPAKTAKKPVVKEQKKLTAKELKAAAAKEKTSKVEKTSTKLEKPAKTAKGSEKEQEKVIKASADKAADKASKKGAPKGKGKAKKEEEDMEDVFLDDDLGSSEIEEYEEELAIVEDYDDADDSSDEDVVVEVKDREPEEIVLTDAEGRRYCRARDCDQIAAVDAYCRYHYLLFWKKIQNRKKILADGKLERYIDELTARYPDKFLEMIRRDLRTEKDFLAAIQELEIDESSNENDFEEDTSAFIEEVRGMGEPSGVEDDEF